MKQSKTMVTWAQEYLNCRRNLGYKLQIEGAQLLKFAEYADHSEHKGAVTTELALKWARLPKNASQLYQARRLEIVRCFAKYQAVHDPSTEIPRKGLLGCAHRRIEPHIFSDEQLEQLIKAAKELSPVNGLRPITYATLFGTLASTGLRISEALRLGRNDVDFKHEVLIVVETKFHKSRLIALHPSTNRKLQSYALTRERYHPIPKSDAFFLSEQGKQLKYSTVRHTFRTLCNHLEWQPNGGRRSLRMYDLRHTFACRRLIQWYKEGVNVDHTISALSTYLGHVKVADTYWYITGVPELMQISAQRFEQFVNSNRISQ